mmetsp:Transcript_3128/g.19297  ORF Transcript_3128/g.19297 Transcript_3128/m.19297 type:complete len:200 (+) Transcript_3128:1052-1651(+)
MLPTQFTVRRIILILVGFYNIPGTVITGVCQPDAVRDTVRTLGSSYVFKVFDLKIKGKSGKNLPSIFFFHSQCIDEGFFSILVDPQGPRGAASGGDTGYFHQVFGPSDVPNKSRKDRFVVRCHVCIAHFKRLLFYHLFSEESAICVCQSRGGYHNCCKGSGSVGNACPGGTLRCIALSPFCGVHYSTIAVEHGDIIAID